MASTDIIDMSKLPAPEVVKQYDYETILERVLARFLTYYPDAANAVKFESDPLRKWFECVAYVMMILRQQQNEDAQAVMLAYAQSGDLDQLGAIYQVERLVITPAIDTTMPPTPAVMEGDSAFRRRIQLAPKGFSVAGPLDAYLFHTLSADGRVLDAEITSPNPGDVVVTLLSHEGSGAASVELIDVVTAALSDEDVRPLTDRLSVQSAEIVPYEIKADIYMLEGPDKNLVLEQCQKNAEAYAQDQRKIGGMVPISGIYAALHIAGVELVRLTSPAADVLIEQNQAPWCSGIELNLVTTDGTNSAGQP